MNNVDHSNFDNSIVITLILQQRLYKNSFNSLYFELSQFSSLLYQFTVRNKDWSYFHNPTAKGKLITSMISFVSDV